MIILYTDSKSQLSSFGLIWVGLQMFWVNGCESGCEGMVEQVWHLFWTEKVNPCRQTGAEEDGGGQEGRKVWPLRGEVILQSSPPYTHSYSHTEAVCRSAGWCSHAKMTSAWGMKISVGIGRACVSAHACFFYTYLILNIFLNSWV